METETREASVNVFLFTLSSAFGKIIVPFAIPRS